MTTRLRRWLAAISTAFAPIVAELATLARELTEATMPPIVETIRRAARRIRRTR